ncbi:XRE family transcriptional regulator [Mesorhizobium sp. WSM3860]|uniref:helix-turn-helix domain-containing protein n=1 Tax=Mesorhizobium sp. WSM3860 TaxID=2029403 RepID=UPI000BAF1E20|nr:XRE family transcriptional regulator [Mesorhizobium sp. WSM3860]PBC00715.1 transcriptional regulator [Mesorhizobium sp. WSM3860]
MTDSSFISHREQELGHAIATRLRNLRRDQDLTLDGVAKLTGLSKGTVVALEKGKANPSIGILCRLAAAFSLSVGDLLNDAPRGEADKRIERTVTKTLWTSPAGSSAQLQASTSGRTMFELWSWVLAPGDEFHADAHSPDTRELVTVTAGALTIVVGRESTVLAEGESAHLITDQPHSYIGTADVWTRFTMAVLERGGQRLARKRDWIVGLGDD